MMIDHGRFELYQPDLPEDHPHVRAKALHLRNPKGTDWYAIAHAKPLPGTTFAQVKDGRVNSVSTDPSSLFPIDCILVETSLPVEMGWAYDGETLAPYVPALDDVKAQLIRRIDADAERARQRFITGGAGQGLTYREKIDQALAVLDLGEEAANAMSGPDAIAQFPVLAASIGIDADTLHAAATLVVNKYEAWSSISGAIERMRLGTKRQIQQATDAAAAQAAYEAVTWPT
jgi:hypothetical protein